MKTNSNLATNTTTMSKKIQVYHRKSKVVRENHSR